MKKLFLASRPKTLIAIFAPVLLAKWLSFSEKTVINETLWINCLIIGICIQIATNFFNDYYDFKKGADLKRVGPARFSGSSESFRKLLFYSAIFLLVISFFVAIPLLKISSVYILLGALSLYFSFGYTGGIFPLAYLGLGEVFVFIFFGPVAFLGTYFGLTETFTSSSIILSITLGIYSTLIIGLNNLRDHQEDQKVGKNTLVVKLGEKNYKFFFTAMILALTILNYIWFEEHFILLIINIFFLILLAVKTLKAKRASHYARIFPMSAVGLLLFLFCSRVMIL
jgi:1,4-dihydroxy-2-naphthoate octaprenyltransferase